jgi:hypothetical protein
MPFPYTVGGIAVNSSDIATDQVFVLRFWREESSSWEEPRWRVQVRNVNTRQLQITNDVNAAFAFVSACLDEAVLTAENRGSNE